MSSCELYSVFASTSRSTRWCPPVSRRPKWHVLWTTPAAGMIRAKS